MIQQQCEERSYLKREFSKFAELYLRLCMLAQLSGTRSSRVWHIKISRLCLSGTNLNMVSQAHGRMNHTAIIAS